MKLWRAVGGVRAAEHGDATRRGPLRERPRQRRRGSHRAAARRPLSRHSLHRQGPCPNLGMLPDASNTEAHHKHTLVQPACLYEKACIQGTVQHELPVEFFTSLSTCIVAYNLDAILCIGCMQTHPARQLMSQACSLLFSNFGILMFWD